MAQDDDEGATAGPISDDLGAALLGLGGTTVSREDLSQLRLVDVLQVAPLYRKFAFPETAPKRASPTLTHGIAAFAGPRSASGLKIRMDLRLDLACPTCGVSRTFARQVRGDTDRAGTDEAEVGKTVRLDFGCTYCQKQTAHFLIHVLRKDDERFVTMLKVGQWPSSRPELKPELRSALGDAADLYQKGLSAESAGFGIGAFAYYRRVAEDIIDRLMTNLRRYADEHELTKLVDAIDQVAGEHQASKRIEAVKDLLPKALKIGGTGNPLGAIYGALSAPLHGDTDDGDSDEECLDEAIGLRVAMEFLLIKLDGHVASSEKFASALEGIRKKSEERAAREARKKTGERK